MLVCPDCLLIVNGMLEWAQKWRCHGWMTAKGPVQHRDLWEQLLSLTESLGKHVKWLHTPSHIEIPGNARADHLVRPMFGDGNPRYFSAKSQPTPGARRCRRRTYQMRNGKKGARDGNRRTNRKTRSPHPSSVNYYNTYYNYRAHHSDKAKARGGGGGGTGGAPPTLALVGH